MKKYFTSLDLEDGKFVGLLHDPDTNQVVYKTKKHNSQAQVTSEINEYITKLRSNQTPATQPVRETIVTTTYRQLSNQLKGGCCGR